MSIVNRLVQLRAVAVAVSSFIKRHKRVSIAVALALVILGPLLTGSGGASFFLNLFGLGLAALVVWRIMCARSGRRATRARQAHGRRLCHRQHQAAARQQAQGGTP